MRFSVPFLTGFSDNKTPLCGISPYVFSFFFLRGSLSFPSGFFVLFFAKISRFPLRGCFVLFSSGFLYPSPRDFPVFSRDFPSGMRQKKLPG